MMKIQRHGIGFVVAAIVVALLSSAASAGVILNVPAPAVSGPGLGFASVAFTSTLSPNNDNVPAAGVPDNNITVPLKRFDFADYIDIEFSVAPSNGVTEYQVSEFVDNNTGGPWSSYLMQLGTGTGNNFQLSALNDGLDFDSPTYDLPPTSGAFPIVNAPDEDQLVFSGGGGHGNGAQPYAFRIDVPDMGVEFGHFTLRQIPTAVPEPAAIVLALMSVIGLASLRRRG
jgi:hypothetical protein